MKLSLTRPTRIPAAMAVVLAFPCLVARAGDVRAIDGSGNNVSNPTWGMADTPLLRLAPAAYEDGLSVPRGGDPSSLHSAREVSNEIAAQAGLTQNAAGMSDWIWQWGQFVDHDIDLTGAADPAEPFNIAVPLGDPDFDPLNTGTQEIGLSRSTYTVDGSGVRQQTNQITAYLDASNVYGSDPVRAAALRTLDGTGMLKTSAGDLLPFNTPGLDNAGGTSASLFLAGDVRANEQVGLTATHTLFVREHNRLAQDILARLTASDPVIVSRFIASGLSVGDFVYESARQVVGAELQLITYNEFLPALLGPDALTPYTGYNDTVDASIANAFSTAAYRLGHTLLSPEILRMNSDGTEAPEGNLPLRDAFFNPSQIIDHGIDSILLGLSYGQAQEVDMLMVDDVRNFLFGPPGAGGFDLASLNIQRGRDHGLPSLNAFREAFLGAGTAYDNFLDLASGDTDVAAALASVYDTVDDVDLWVGGLVEPHVNGGMVGETFFGVVVDQFTRLRDGDRFYYLDHLDDLLALDPGLESTTLSDVVRRNTGITSMSDQAFVVSAAVLSAVPEPVTATLSLGALMALVPVIGRRRVG